MARTAQPPTVQITVTWDDRTKTWDVHGSRYVSGKLTGVWKVRPKSRNELDGPALVTLVTGVAHAIDSWLF